MSTFKKLSQQILEIDQATTSISLSKGTSPTSKGTSPTIEIIVLLNPAINPGKCEQSRGRLEKSGGQVSPQETCYAQFAYNNYLVIKSY